MAKGRLRWRRLLAAMLVPSVLIIAADGVRRDFFKSSENSIVVDGDFKTADTAEETIKEENVSLSIGTQPTTVFEGIQNLGYSELSVPSSKLSSGALTIINNEHPADGSSTAGMIDLLEYKNEFYSLDNDSIELNKDAAEAFNAMMEAYNKATGLSDFVVYRTNKTFTGEGSLCPDVYPESVMGNTVDLVLNGCNGQLAFDGLDEEGWILDNCCKFGFIVRYPKGKSAQTGQEFCPWHLRYVGDVHAAVMGEKNMCLEEYVEFLKNYTYDKPFTYTCNNVGYKIYSAAAEGESVSVRIPVSGKYDISGDNINAYFITALKN